MPTDKEDRRVTFITWLVGLMALVALAGVPWAFAMHGQAQATRVEMSSMSKNIDTLAETIKELAQGDIADLRKRMAQMEMKKILPEARKDIDELEHRVRELELKTRSQ